MNTPTNDQDRGDWPSASAWEANTLCPGRHQAQIGLPEPPQGPDAESGTAIHAAWAGAPIRALTPDEEETLEGLRAKEAAIVAQWRAGDTRPTRPLREKRLWMIWDTDRGLMACSGQADVIYIDPPSVLIIDGKTGRKAVTPEPQNLQLRVLAALVHWNFSAVEEVTVAIAQHWTPTNPPCVYNLDALVFSASRARMDVEAWIGPNPRRVPSAEACLYCRAKSTCPEFTAGALPVKFEAPPVLAPTNSEIALTIANLPGDRLGAFLALCRLAEDCATAEVRRRLADAQDVPGWHIGPGRTTETISDPQTLFNRFIALGGNTEEFLTAIRVVKSSLKGVVRQTTGLKGKALDAKLDDLLQGITESKTSAPVLERD